MSDHLPYYPNVAASDRGRLRNAAKRGDKRAEATLAHLEQQKHEDAWAATDADRAALAAARAEREKQRPSSVTAAMDARRKARDEKKARQAEAAEAFDGSWVARPGRY